MERACKVTRASCDMSSVISNSPLRHVIIHLFTCASCYLLVCRAYSRMRRVIYLCVEHTYVCVVLFTCVSSILTYVSCYYATYYGACI
jgi:hypothetical protein